MRFTKLFSFYEKPKKSDAGPVEVYLLLGGVNNSANSDLNANNAVFYSPVTIQRGALLIALYGFANGY
jgi:hypothetical protein